MLDIFLDIADKTFHTGAHTATLFYCCEKELEISQFSGHEQKSPPEYYKDSFGYNLLDFL